MVIATQNPVEYEGTFPLPEAQLDRFAVRVTIGYPPAERRGGDAARPRRPRPRRAGAPGHRRGRHPRAPRGGGRPGPRGAGLAAVRGGAGRPPPAATRASQLGASPRAGLSLLRAAKARALLAGRGYALPDDVRALATSVLSHRLILTPDARARGTRAEEVVADALATVPVPL